MLVNFNEMLAHANKNGYAVGGFDSTNYQLAEYIIEAAENLGTPVILMVPPFALGRRYDREFLSFLPRRAEKARVPVAVELDHGESFEQAVFAIECGFNAVMFDGSALSFEQNAAETARIAAYAHARGVALEAEIGRVGGTEGSFGGSEADESLYTRTEDAMRFVELTGADALAVSFGTVHGPFKGEPKLDFDRLSDIKGHIEVPLVMHGGSGLSDADYTRVVKCGINKINYFSDMSLSATNAFVKAVSDAGGTLHMNDALVASEECVVKIVENRIKLFETMPII